MTSRARPLFRLDRTFTFGFAALLLVGCSGDGSGGDLGGAAVGGTPTTPGGSGSVGGYASGGVNPVTGVSTLVGPQGGTANVATGGVSSVTTTAGSSVGGTVVVGTGGNASGGTPSVGGTSAKGGASSVGGTSAKGGTSSVGGTSAKGGTSSVGGTSAKGGTSSVGGTSAKGGTSSVGGTSAKGGTSSVGGTSSTGGTTGTSNQIWISPTGSDSNPGTQASPMFTLCDTTAKVGACYKLCPGGTSCVAGGTIWVMAGTYSYTATQKTGSTFTGTAAANMNIFAVAGTAPVFDFSKMAVADASRGIQIGGNYWHVRGITVTKAGDTGIFVMGNYNTIEQCITHHNQDAGIVIGVNSSVAGSGSNNLILNCDSYTNFDTANGGENADGFGAKKSSGGVNNTFRGCRAWDNSDDGYDFYGWTEAITLENCWAMSQAKTTEGSNSDGNGFKLGDETSGSNAKHKLTNCYATDNKYGTSGKGIIGNGNPASITYSSCAAWSNTGGSDSGVSTTAPGSATAAKMIAAKRNADGSLPAISTL